jgi:hypothetical protein
LPQADDLEYVVFEAKLEARKQQAARGMTSPNMPDEVNRAARRIARALPS